MPNTSPKLMGKAKAPSFFKGEVGQSSPVKKINIPVLLMIGLAGLALVLFMRSRSTTVSTGPAVSINAGSAPDQSTIDNLTASILAVNGRVHVPSPIPTGGASTPITVTPAQSGFIPGAAIPNPPPPTYQGTVSYYQQLLSALKSAPSGAATVPYAGGNWSTNPESVANVQQTLNTLLKNAPTKAA